MTPGPGDSWTLVDASNISGSFAAINSNTAIAEPGYGFFVETAAGGTNGRVARLSIDARLLLEVDRGTVSV